MKRQQLRSSSCKIQQRIAPAIFLNWQAPAPLAPRFAAALTGGVENAIEALRLQHVARFRAVDALGAAIRAYTGDVAAVAEEIAIAARDTYRGPLTWSPPAEPRARRKVERAAKPREHVTTLALRMRGEVVYRPDGSE